MKYRGIAVLFVVTIASMWVVYKFAPLRNLVMGPPAA